VLALASILSHAPELRARAHGERLAANDRLVALLARRGSSHARRLTVAVTAMTAAAGAEFQAWAAGGGRGDPSARITAALALLESGLAQLDG
jgi:hypothetical protein